MFQFFANLFGYLLNFINNIIGNYGLAIILFTILIKLIMLPLSIKQQKTMKKTAKIQEKLKILQFKYKNDPEKLNRETMNLYKEEKMSPFSGCFSAIIQFVLLISVFYMVRCPLTYMEKIDTNKINTYVSQLKEDGKITNQAYVEIDIIRELDYLKEKNQGDETLNEINMNMNFLGIDLSKVPQSNLTDWTVYIIPILYIISTFISMKITNDQTKKNNEKSSNSNVIEIKNENNDDPKGDNNNKKQEDEESMEDAIAQSNKMMSWMMPILSVSISLVAPLGLALYWLMNNCLMILERLLLNKFIKD